MFTDNLDKVMAIAETSVSGDVYIAKNYPMIYKFKVK
jgi:hypothetical protein